MSAHSKPGPHRWRLIVAEDHPAMRFGLAAALGREPDIEVVGEAGNREELLELVTKVQVDVIVLDLVLQEGDGLALLRELASQAPAARVLVFSLQPELLYAERCLRAGARGYVMKEEPVERLVHGVRRVAAGDIFVSDRVATLALEAMPSPGRKPAEDIAQLTDRELQVFRLTGLGLATSAIAAKLGVSIKTVAAHRDHIRAKLGLSSHAAMVARAASWISTTKT